MPPATAYAAPDSVAPPIPRWIRGLVGAGLAAAVLTIVIYEITAAADAAALQAAAAGRRPSSQRGGDITAFLVLLGSFAFGALMQVAADLGRRPARLGLAVLHGGLTAGACLVGAAIVQVGPPVMNLAVPFIGGVPIAIRAAMRRPPTSHRRAEELLAWTFAGAFWASAVAVGVGFLLRQPVFVLLGPLKALVIPNGAAVFGLLYALMLCTLDPDAPEGETDAASRPAAPPALAPVWARLLLGAALPAATLGLLDRSPAAAGSPVAVIAVLAVASLGLGFLTELGEPRPRPAAALAVGGALTAWLVIAGLAARFVPGAGLWPFLLAPFAGGAVAGLTAPGREPDDAPLRPALYGGLVASAVVAALAPVTLALLLATPLAGAFDWARTGYQAWLGASFTLALIAAREAVRQIEAPVAGAAVPEQGDATTSASAPTPPAAPVRRF